MTVDVEAWTRSIDQFLAVARAFIQTSGNNAFLRGIRGEILTLRQILQTHRETLSLVNAQLGYGGSSRKGHDIMIRIGDREVRLDCKEKTEGDHWVRLHGRTFADVTVDELTRQQHVEMRTDFRHDFYYIFVDSVGFSETGEASFYLLSDKEAKETIGSIYKRRLEGKKRIRNENSDDFWVYPAEIGAFSDNSLERLPLRGT